MKVVFTFLIFLGGFYGFAQNLDLSIEEEKLNDLLLDLRIAETEDERQEKNKIFKAALEQVLQNPLAINYSFSKLETVGFIDSPDGKMRIVNWNVEKEDFSHDYFCFVLHEEERKGDYHVTELKDISFGMPMQPTEIIGSNEWYGALYYRIIPFEKSGKTQYAVLGWDYYSEASQMRIIDVMYFTGKTLKLGSPVFKVGKETHKRMMYEHSKKASMSLTYEENRHRIIFDHLSPEAPSMVEFRSFYVPDMSYDAFVLEGSRWVLHEDVIGTNPEQNNNGRQVVYIRNEKTGEIERKEIKAKWMNPEDADAPAGGSEHVAVTPDDVVNSENEAKDNSEPTVNKRDKRDPSTLSFYKDMDKKRKKRKNN